jgi:transposase
LRAQLRSYHRIAPRTADFLITNRTTPNVLPAAIIVSGLATAIVATAADPKVFRSGRDFAAWIGLVPRQDSTGGKQKLGPISKQGDQYLRRILIVGAISVLRRALQNPGKYPWLTQLLARRPFKVVAVGARQQDGAHGLGADGPRRYLSGS